MIWLWKLQLLCLTFCSYERIKPCTWSGAYHCWGRENREAPLRTSCPPGTQHDVVSNFELKSFDGCANPHLGLAAIMAAGIDGLRKHLQLPAPIGELSVWTSIALMYSYPYWFCVMVTLTFFWCVLYDRGWSFLFTWRSSILAAHLIRSSCKSTSAQRSPEGIIRTWFGEMYHCCPPSKISCLYWIISFFNHGLMFGSLFQVFTKHAQFL